MSARIARALRFCALGLGLSYLLPLACGSGGVVGGKCKAKYCGALGAAGDDGQSGSGGKSSGSSGTANNDAGAGAGTVPIGGDGQLPDGGFFDSPVDGQGDAMAPLECMPPYDSPNHCGDCMTQCTGKTPLCAPDGNGGFECVPRCVDPLIECRGQCVSPDSFKSDPDNCGRCGHVCPSGICQDSECVGARYGNVALLCSDFDSATANSPLTALLGNAVFMPPVNPVKVLAYTRGARAAAVTRVHNVIGWAGSPRNRSAEITEAKTVDAVTSNLNINDYQVLLIHDLDQAAPGDPARAATTWEAASVLSSFGRAGGVIVVIDGGDGTGEMNELINAGKLLDPSGKTSISGQTDISNQQVWDSAPFDVLGANVLSPFLGTSHTCRFETDAKAQSDTIFVLTDQEMGGAPVAIHRVIAP